MHEREIQQTELGEVIIERDLSTQVLKLEIEETASPWDTPNQDEGGIYAPLVLGGGKPGEQPLYANIQDIAGPGSECFVSASMLALKAKRFDDALMAEVEHLADQNGPGFVSKPTLLEGLLAHLNDRYDPEEPDENVVQTMGFLTAALSLAGDSPVVGRKIKQAAGLWRKEFLNRFDSKPIGFYDQTLELRQIFRRDRFLGLALEPGHIQALAEALQSDDHLHFGYRTLLHLHARLTNPLTGSPLPKVGGSAEGCRFFPPSESPEGALSKQLFKGKPIPEGFDLIEEMITRVRDGRLDLAPGPESGWYAYQLHALEPLLRPDTMPEAAKLKLGERYRTYLTDLFKGLMAMTRETHIKNLEWPAIASAAPEVNITINPRLSLEPLPQMYRRRAESYAFVRDLLEEIFGEAVMHRSLIRPNRKVSTKWSIDHSLSEPEKPLAERLAEMESLFAGAYYQSCAEIGMTVDPLNGSGRERLQDRMYFRSWLREWWSDRRLSGDLRAMVPLFYDKDRKKVKVAAIAGFSQDRLDIDFETKPGVKVARPDGTPMAVSADWEGQRVELIYPVTFECYVDKVMDRKEFRDLCDEHGSLTAIRKAIE
ncbi:MAG: hypothetical protein QNK37_04225 [Acidobacteriota bacterium]|nr:hypothetical protein [Acidobacteriota bacterium]